jgi:hypothetical protein
MPTFAVLDHLLRVACKDWMVLGRVLEVVVHTPEQREAEWP